MFLIKCKEEEKQNKTKLLNDFFFYRRHRCYFPIERMSLRTKNGIEISSKHDALIRALYNLVFYWGGLHQICGEKRGERKRNTVKLNLL